MLSADPCVFWVDGGRRRRKSAKVPFLAGPGRRVAKGRFRQIHFQSYRLHPDRVRRFVEYEHGCRIPPKRLIGEGIDLMEGLGHEGSSSHGGAVVSD